MGENNANSFVDKISIDTYIQKLVPDLGVFDLVEKYIAKEHIDENKIFKELFFYIPENTSVDGIKFRRFIIKYSGKEPSLITSKIDEIFYYKFQNNGNSYNVIIDQNLSSGGFKIIAPSDSYVIGVCF